MFNLATCPECGHSENLVDFIQDPNPPVGNSGVWCPVCEISLELTNDGGLRYYLEESNIQETLEHLKGSQNLV